MPDHAPDETRALLSQWHAGDRDALDALLARDLSWLHAYVRQRLGGRLREKLETMDIVQDAAMDVMQYGPRFVVSDRRQFRALLGKILENNLRDHHRRNQAKKRDQRREQQIPSDSVLELDSTERSVTQPDEAAERDDFKDWVRLALELLSEPDRRVIVLRQLEHKSFEEIAGELGGDANTIRMRFHRALPKLAETIENLRDGKLDTLLE